MPKSAVVDADGHILEPPETWERYLEPKYRDRAIRIGVDAKGLDTLRSTVRPAKCFMVAGSAVWAARIRI